VGQIQGESDMMRSNYKEQQLELYAMGLITYEEYLDLLKRHEAKLEKRRKYRKGEPITSLDELVKQDLVYNGDKIEASGWFMSYQLSYINNQIKRNCIFKVVKKESNV
jgi:hypothetical protein